MMYGEITVFYCQGSPMGSSGEHCLQTLSDADKCHLGDDFSEANGSHWNVIPLDDAPRVFYLYSDVGFGGNNQYLSWTEAGGAELFFRRRASLQMDDPQHFWGDHDRSLWLFFSPLPQWVARLGWPRGSVV